MFEIKRVLVTGVSSGIGRATADKLIDMGAVVYGIDVSDVSEKPGQRFFKCDVTDTESLQRTADALASEGVVLDAIVNVAGIHMMTSLVEGDYTKMKKLIDINLGGVMLVNRLFHPLLCECGRILIVTSEVAGLDPLPFNGLYTVSKTALDSYAQALRQELNLIGQKVITVRPGAIETPLARESINATEALAESTKLYSKGASKFSGIAKRFMGTPIAPERIASVIARALTKKSPRPTYSKHRNPGLVLLGILPIGLQCRIIKMLLK